LVFQTRVNNGERWIEALTGHGGPNYMKFNSKVLLATTAIFLTIPASDANAQAIRHQQSVRTGPGRVSASRRTIVTGAMGTAGRRATNTVMQDGTVTHRSGSVVHGPNGQRVARAGRTQFNPDGSVSHDGGFKATGENGTITSTGSSQRGTDGSASAQRNTTATGKNGKTYEGTTTWQKGEGVQHTSTCTDSSGHGIPCK
jgi:hypothetical protein